MFFLPVNERDFSEELGDGLLLQLGRVDDVVEARGHVLGGHVDPDGDQAGEDDQAAPVLPPEFYAWNNKYSESAQRLLYDSWKAMKIPP